MTTRPHIDFVFDGPPEVPGRFIEVEDAHGNSISRGVWLRRPDGYWVLRMPDPGPSAMDVEVSGAN